MLVNIIWYRFQWLTAYLDFRKFIIQFLFHFEIDLFSQRLLCYSRLAIFRTQMQSAMVKQFGYWGQNISPNSKHCNSITQQAQKPISLCTMCSHFLLPPKAKKLRTKSREHRKPINNSIQNDIEKPQMHQNFEL